MKTHQEAPTTGASRRGRWRRSSRLGVLGAAAGAGRGHRPLLRHRRRGGRAERPVLPRQQLQLVGRVAGLEQERRAGQVQRQLPERLGALTRCLGYVEQVFGSDSSLLQGQVGLRALRLVLNTLVCGSGGDAQAQRRDDAVQPQRHRRRQQRHVGLPAPRVAPMDATRCAEMLADLETIDAKITTPDFKGPSSAEYGAPLYEAFKYFGGYARPAGGAATTGGARRRHPLRTGALQQGDRPRGSARLPRRAQDDLRRPDRRQRAAARTTSSSSATPGPTRSTAPTPTPRPIRPTC